ncbi:hypothetical protein [Mesorhizobium opportunistum]|uniref:Uncharacterized protein n=1 Tax=Mesorhizobium opportunistum (strain LMG 24607 / HAMBI 3007 / WSM2075) TaxID=536019 RepID=F7XZV3_MESOW|nr:hypothetical protein [Mesorhizobium opportunistum]AEH88167.1 hypothetical protein Mesop_3725 [Mesorhizobium opportunistum WSM2075]
MGVLLMVKDAGRGITPPCAQAKFKSGDVVAVSRRKHVRHVPESLVVLTAIPPGFPGEYALSDLIGEPRPLMISKPLRVVSYILCREGDPRPYHLREADISETGQSVEIGTISREGDEVRP